MKFGDDGEVPTEPKRPLPCADTGDCAIDTGEAVRKQDVGFFEAARNIGRIWPLVLLVVFISGFALNAEMRRSNAEQDAVIEQKYVTKVEFEARMRSIENSIRDVAENQRETNRLLSEYVSRGSKK